MNEHELTIKKLKTMNAGWFAIGIGTYPELEEIEIKWVAVRGGIHDWCIYYDKPEKTKEEIAAFGFKIHDRELIQRLVPADKEAINMYRD